MSEDARSVEAAVKQIGEGGCVVIIDSGSNVSERGCSLALAAEHVTTERTAFLIKNSAGIISACLDRDRLDGFGLRPDAGSDEHNSSAYVSIDFLPGITNGVSAKDRASTLKALCDTSNSPGSFRRPGHTFPCHAAKGGVLEWPRRSEAVYDLCRLSKLTPVGAMAELMSEDGSTCSSEEAYAFARKHSLPAVTIEQVVAYWRSREHLKESHPKPPTCINLETESQMWMDDVEADCTMRVYSTNNRHVEIVAICKGDLKGVEGVPARVHSECFTGDILGSKRCDCGQQLHKFLRVMNTETCGVLIYVRGHEGRGIGLANKIRAYKLQDQGLDTVEANLRLGLPVDDREFETSLAVLRDLGLKSVRLYTNNPEKMASLRPIVYETVALSSIENERNAGYLRTKRERLNHKTVLETFKLPARKMSEDEVAKMSIGIVYTTWNEYYVNEVLRAGEEELENKNVSIEKMSVPGATDLMAGCRAIIRQKKPDAVIVIGVLIRGKSDVYEVTCNAVTQGLTAMNSNQDTPIILAGLLYCRDEDQAYERSHGPGNPGKAIAGTAIHMAAICSTSEDRRKSFSRQASPADAIFSLSKAA